jgi:hypothetical protein
MVFLNIVNYLCKIGNKFILLSFLATLSWNLLSVHRQSIYHDYLYKKIKVKIKIGNLF